MQQKRNTGLLKAVVRALAIFIAFIVVSNLSTIINSVGILLLGGTVPALNITLSPVLIIVGLIVAAPMVFSIISKVRVEMLEHGLKVNSSLASGSSLEEPEPIASIVSVEEGELV